MLVKQLQSALKPSVLVNSAPVPGVAEQKVMNDTALHLLWEDKNRVILLIEANQEPLAPLPQEVNVLYDTGRILALSNRNTPLQAAAPHTASADVPLR